MTIQATFSDIDGTLLNDEHRIFDHNQRCGSKDQRNSKCPPSPDLIHKN